MTDWHRMAQSGYIALVLCTIGFFCALGGYFWAALVLNVTGLTSPMIAYSIQLRTEKDSEGTA